MFRYFARCAGFGLLLFGGACVSVRAAFCGPAADTTAIEKLTIQAHNTNPLSKVHQIDETFVFQVDAQGDYGYSMVGMPQGMGSYYWHRDDSGWHLVPSGNPPASWPAQVRTHFDNDVNSMGYGNGKTRCANPNYKDRSAGG